MATATLVSHGTTTPLSSQFHQPWRVVWTMSPMARTECRSIEHVGCDAPGSFPADTLQAAVAHLPRKMVARTGTAQNQGSCVTDLPCRAFLLRRRVHPRVGAAETYGDFLTSSLSSASCTMASIRTASPSPPTSVTARSLHGGRHCHYDQVAQWHRSISAGGCSSSGRHHHATDATATTSVAAVCKTHQDQRDG